jgi:hypothetical protein
MASIPICSAKRLRMSKERSAIKIFSAATPRFEQDGVLKTIPASMEMPVIGISVTGVHCSANSGFISVGLQAESSESVP